MTPRMGDRSLFPTLAAKAYLNHAAISPPSEPVRAAVARLLEDYAREGVGAFPRWQEQRERLRGKLAATDAMATVLPCDWIVQPGNGSLPRVVTMS